MSRFVGSAQEATVKRYLPYLKQELINQAFDEKLKRTRRAKDRERLQSRLSVLGGHLLQFWECVRRNELAPEDVFEATHFAAYVCWQYATRDSVLSHDIRTGRAFAGVMRGMRESAIVWDKFDQAAMRSIKPPTKLNKRRKLKS